MKKSVALLLSAAMALSLAACGGSKDPAPTGETLTGTDRGYGGDVTVTLTREDDAITACSIEGKDETPEIGGKALAELEKQVVAANGFDIDGVSGATITSTAVKKAVATALGKSFEEPEKPPVTPATPAPIVEIEGGLQLGLAYGAPHGTKSFGEAYAVVKDDVIVAAFIDEFQFLDATLGLAYVPNSDTDFAAGYAEGQALASKRMVADYYSQLMTDHAKATVRIDDNFDAVQNFAVGKTIAEVEAVATGDKAAAVDAVSGATLVDTAGYLDLIVQAAKNAQSTQAVEFTGDSSQLDLKVAYSAAHGAKCFTASAALMAGDTIVLSYIDEFQFVASDAGLDTVPNSDADFAAGYAEGKALASKRMVADYYSQNMAEKAGSTVRIDDNFTAIQNHVNGMTVAEAKALAEKGAEAVDAVSGATLADTAGYVNAIIIAAES